MTPEQFDESVAKRYLKDGQEPPFGVIALGLSGESAELWSALDDAEHDPVVNELGDVSWYAAAMLKRLGSSFAEICDIRAFRHDPHTSSNDLASCVMGCAGAISDAVKKHEWHGKPLDEERLTDLVAAMLDVVAILADRVTGKDGEGLAEVLAANHAKLEARYPNGFVEGGGVR